MRSASEQTLSGLVRYPDSKSLILESASTLFENELKVNEELISKEEYLKEGHEMKHSNSISLLQQEENRLYAKNKRKQNKQCKKSKMENHCKLKSWLSTENMSKSGVRNPMRKSQSMVNLRKGTEGASKTNSIMEEEPSEKEKQEKANILRYGGTEGITDSTPKCFWDSARIWLQKTYKELEEDFSEIQDIKEPFQEDPFWLESLNLLKLKRNIIRFANTTDPLMDSVKLLIAVIRWENPILTTLVFMLYMSSVYYGWFLSVFFASLIFLFSLAFFHNQSTDVNPEFLWLDDFKEVEKRLNVINQMSVIMYVIRRIQNYVFRINSTIEKIKNLLLWHQPKLTSFVFCCVLIALLASLILSATQLCAIAGLLFGIYLFIIDYILVRFPRIGKKYDIPRKIIYGIKDHSQQRKIYREKVNEMAAILSLVNIVPDSSESETSPSSDCREMTFTELFHFPTTEVPLPEWKNGRRCTFIRKGNPLKTTYKQGKLYLTSSYICFEKHKCSSEKNFVISLASITEVKKFNLFRWIPGGGIAIKIKTFNKKSYVFLLQNLSCGSLAKCENVYNQLVDRVNSNDINWPNKERKSTMKNHEIMRTRFSASLKNLSRSVYQLNTRDENPMRRSQSLQFLQETPEPQWIPRSIPSINEEQEEDSISQPASLWGSAKVWLQQKYAELEEDFSEIQEIKDPFDDDPFWSEAINIWKLKKNIVRFANVTDPIVDFLKQAYAVLRWQNPLFSGIIFMTYMISIYNGWFISFLLAGLVFFFILTYFHHIGVGEKPEFLWADNLQETEKKLNLVDQMSVILYIARRVQNYTSVINSLIEKIKNLLLWRQPEITSLIFGCLVMALLATLIFPTSQLCFLAALFLGVYMFIIDYIFIRFPRFGKKYDILRKILNGMKNESEMAKLQHENLHRMASTISLFSTVSTDSSGSDSGISPSGSRSSVRSENFAAMFHLPSTETPLSGWENGRRCTFVRKGKTLKTTYKQGKLYLTNSYICFERHKYSSPKNFMISLSSISKIKKTKLYSWIPGGGMAIKIRTCNNNKCHVFAFQDQLYGPLATRDDIYNQLMDFATRNRFHWANTN